MEINMGEVLKQLVAVQYTRNDIEMGRGKFRVRGDVLEIGPAYEDRIIRIEFFGEEVDTIRAFNPVDQLSTRNLEFINIVPDIQGKILHESRESFLEFISEKTLLPSEGFDGFYMAKLKRLT